MRTFEFSPTRRFCEGPVAFRFPLALSGVAQLTESYDDRRGCYTIAVDVANRRLGHLFGYRGEFGCEVPAVPAGRVPPTLTPLREQRRT